ncbi:heme exporter protein CcmB [Magnetovibrio sp.]|uniref:heme exporter protein CcmB n=1 Tax=Magnetovibrio sp. TaxID=2024836 RepID=UPI002F9305D3
MGKFIELVKRDIALAFRQGMDSLMVVAFFIIAVVLFPFGVGPEVNTLAKIAGGTIWVAALLSSMLSLERLFQTDYDDGSLELLALAPVPLEITVLAKVAAHWLTTGLPLIVTAPLLAVLMQLPDDGFWTLLGALMLGTPTLSLIGAVGAALILGSRRGGVLLSLLVLPLYIPILIFGVSAVDAAIFDQAVRPHMLFLAALLVGSLALTPWAAAAGLRQALE